MSVQTKESVRETALFVYVSISAILAAVGLIVFAPILISIEGSKDAIVKRFVFLPPLVKLALQKQSEKRALTLKRNFSDADEEEEGDNFGLGDDDVGGDEKGISMDGKNLASGVPYAEGDNNDGDVDWDAVMAQVKAKEQARAMRAKSVAAAAGSESAPSTAVDVLTTALGVGGSAFPTALSVASVWSRWLHTGSRSNASYKKSSTSVVLLFGKFLGPLLALFLFFTVMFIGEPRAPHAPPGSRVLTRPRPLPDLSPPPFRSL